MLSITSISGISAIYFALLHSGYDFYAMGRDSEHIEAIKAFSGMEKDFDFFTRVKQNTCVVYPYWPRAALLESACFFIRSDGVGFDDFGGLRDKVMSASNLADHERNQEFWNWIEDFPRSLEQVLYDEGFRSYLAWEEEWVRQQNVIYGKELREIQDILDVCSKRYPTASIKTIEIVLNPIKCVYSTDYHLIGERFIFCSGTFDKDSVIHEFLHPIVHPVVEAHRKDILRHKIHYPGIDESYYLSGDEMGQLNAFEEYFVRRLTNIVCAKHPPDDLGGFLKELLYSFM